MPGMAGGMGAFAPGLPQRTEAMRGAAFYAMFGGAECERTGAGMNGMTAQAMPGFGMSSNPMASLNMGLVWSCASQTPTFVLALRRI